MINKMTFRGLLFTDENDEMKIYRVKPIGAALNI